MKLPVAIIGQDNLALVSLSHQLDKETDYVVHNRIIGFDDSVSFLQTKTGSIIVILDSSRDSEKAFRILEEIKSRFPNTHLILTSSDDSSETLLRAMRSGAEEFFIQPFNWPEVLNSLDAIRKRISVQSAELGKMITVFSSKGGVGSTTAVTNLAIALAARKQVSVCIVDLVLQFGSVTTFLNLDTTYTIVDLVKNLERLDPLLLDGLLAKHTSGIRVLSAPSRFDHGKNIGLLEVNQILDCLLRSFDIVIVDTPKALDQTTLAALDKAFLILFLAEVNILSLKGAYAALASFEAAGLDRGKIRLVVNRHIKQKTLTLELVEKTLGTKVFWKLPNDYATATDALNQGLSLHEANPKCELAKSYEALGGALLTELAFASGPARGHMRRKLAALARWIPTRSTRERQAS